jgi:uncharacterized protein (TIGR02594 family)
MLSRRRFLALTALLGWTSPSAVLASRLFDQGQLIPTLDELISEDDKLTGRESPFPSQVVKSRIILAAAEQLGTPVDVAMFFDELRHGKKDAMFGPDASIYAEEWKKTYNPVIVSFFDSTTIRKPDGDITPWCAAFVNWCITKSKQGKSQGLSGTNSARAQSFRDWGVATNDPQHGDIVVFRKTDSSGRGHVGFYIADDQSTVSVLGGNQQPRSVSPGTYDTPRTGEINITRYPKRGKSLELTGYRTHPALR